MDSMTNIQFEVPDDDAPLPLQWNVGKPIARVVRYYFNEAGDLVYELEPWQEHDAADCDCDECRAGRGR